MKEKDIGQLQHTTWKCQYHIVFAAKFRRLVIYGQIKKDIGQILRKLCEQKGGRNNRSRSLPRPHPYADQYTTQIQCITDYGIPQR